MKIAIKYGKNQSWKQENDGERCTWETIRNILQKMIAKQKTPGIDDLAWVREIVRSLFNAPYQITENYPTTCDIKWRKIHCWRITNHRSWSSKAPVLDGVSNEVLRIAIRICPAILHNAFYKCLEQNTCYKRWKKQHVFFSLKVTSLSTYHYLIGPSASWTQWNNYWKVERSIGAKD